MKAFKLDTEPKIPSGFSVPENYFENFSVKFLEDFPKEEPKIIPLFSKSKKIILAVAAVLVAALSFPLYNHFSASTAPFDTLTVENYLAYQPNITQYDLINEMDVNQALPYNEITTADATIVEEYLLKEGNLEQLILE